MSLKDWFGKGPKGDWVRMGTDGKIKGPCAREPGEGKPKCLPRSKASSMSLKDRASAVRRKRREDPVADRKGKGGKPVNVNTHKEEFIVEKAKPTNPALWSRAKSAARAKFDVYPSAYANGWAVRWYKKRGGGWRTVKEETEIKPHKMYKDDKVVLAKNKADHDRLNKLGYTHDNPKTKKVEEEKGYCSCDCDCKQKVCKTCGMPRKITEKCWDGYKQAGMKKKGKKVVPNCVPESESLGAMIARAQSRNHARDWNKLTPAQKLAKLKKEREDTKKRMAEDTELTELSKSYLKKYLDKATAKYKEPDYVQKALAKKPGYENNPKREKGIARAFDKISRTKTGRKSTKIKVAATEGKEHSWRTDGHYKKDGTEYTGDQHAHEGQVMTGKTHTKDSENLYHFKDLSPEVKKKVLERMKMDEGIVDTVMKSKTLNKSNYAIAAKELDKKMKKDPSKTKAAHAHDVARYVKNVDARKLAAEEIDMTGCPLLEKLSPSDGIGNYIKDFKKSDAPQFKGASASKRRKMAVAAYLGAKRKKMEESIQYDSSMGGHEWGTPQGTDQMKSMTPGQKNPKEDPIKPLETKTLVSLNVKDEYVKEARYQMSKKNPVAKNLNKFNKPATHKDRKNDYSRKDKHKGKIYEEGEAGETKAEYRADNEINAPEAGIVPLTKDDVAHLYAEIDTMTDEQMEDYGFFDEYDDEYDDYESNLEWDDFDMEDVDITEVLSVQGRLKRRFAARKNRQKLKVARNIALRRGSSPDRLKKRATRGARSMVYKRLLKGRDKSAMPPAEKARFERLIGMYQPLIQRFAQRMLPKMRKMEISRMKSRKGGAQKAKKYKAARPVNRAGSQKAKKFKVKKR